jgi:hypothetical protein
MAKHILEMISEWMRSCECYDDRFCDNIMCPECPCCEKNLKYEYYKVNMVCPKCHGLKIFSGLSADLFFKSVTTNCNVCAGSGAFIVSI